MAINFTGMTFGGMTLSGPPSAVADAQFNYVSALFSGEGTNTAQNNTFLDGSTNNFSITPNGTTTQGSFSPYGVNWSVSLGAGDYLQLPTSTSAFQFGTNNFTIECWVYLNSSVTAANRLIWYNYPVTFSTDCIYFGGHASYSGQMTFWAYNVNNSAPILLDPTVLTAGVWTHIAVVRNGTTFTMYRDGVSVSTATSSANIVGNTYTYGGYIGTSGTTSINGYISNFRMVNGTAVYTSAFTPPTAPLTAVTNTAILTCQSNRFIDTSINALAITPNVNSSIQRYNPFGTVTTYSTSVIGGSGYYSGSGGGAANTDSLVVADNNALELGSSNFTWECWVYLTASPSVAVRILDKDVYGSTSYLFYISSTSYPTFTYSIDGTTQITLAASSTVPINSWAHLAVTRSGSTITIWLNGVSIRTATESGTFYNGSASLYIGNASSNDRAFPGYISNLRLVKGTAVYTATFTPPTAPLTAITNTSLLLNYVNGGIYDNAMMNNLITVGSAQISTAQYKFGSSSMYFDGSGYLKTIDQPILNMGNGKWTIEMWIRPTGNYTSYNTILAKRAATIASTTAYELFLNTGDGRLGYYNGAIYLSTTTPTANVWSYVAWVFDGTNINIYLNGTSILSTAVTNANVASDLYIGCFNYNGTPQDYYIGYIDDLRITKGVARYNTNFTAPTTAFPTLGP